MNGSTTDNCGRSRQSRWRSVLLVLASAHLWACTGRAGEDAPSGGCYTYGHEVNTFRPFPGDSTFWVVGVPSVLQELRSAHDSLASKPYEAVWARVVVQRSAKQPDGFARDFDGLIEILRVLEIRRAVAPECS
jgi:hypothetical protein